MYRAALCIIMIFAIATPAYSQETRDEQDDEIGIATTDLQLREGQQQRILGQLFIAPIYFMGYITVHEGSHALWGMAFGLEIERFQPYPHYEMRDIDDDEDGYVDRQERVFYWGSVRYENIPDDFSRVRGALINIAPYLTDVIWFGAADLLLQYVVDPHSFVAPFLLVGGMVTPLVNFITGLNCMNQTCDMSRFSEHSGLPRGAVMMIGYSLAAIAVWRIMHHFRRIFMEIRPRSINRDLALSVAPITDSEQFGLDVSGSF